jgi:hypothetical protein
LSYTFPTSSGSESTNEPLEAPSEIAHGLRIFVALTRDVGLLTEEFGPLSATAQRHLRSANLLLYLAEKTASRDGTPSEYPTYDESGRYVGTGTDKV